jgi:hypothetical protein
MAPEIEETGKQKLIAWSLSHSKIKIIAKLAVSSTLLR